MPRSWFSPRPHLPSPSPCGRGRARGWRIQLRGRISRGIHAAYTPIPSPSGGEIDDPAVAGPVRLEGMDIIVALSCVLNEGRDDVSCRPVLVVSDVSVVRISALGTRFSYPYHLGSRPGPQMVTVPRAASATRRRIPSGDQSSQLTGCPSDGLPVSGCTIPQILPVAQSYTTT